MNVAVPSGADAGERRVALVPEGVKRLRGRGLEVSVETGAGAGAWFPDEEYRDAGARVEPSLPALLGAADLVVQVHPPSPRALDLLRPGAVLVCPLAGGEPGLLERLATSGVTTIAVDRLPRTTLAQSMDVLTSQATAAGYRAVLLAAAALPRFFPLLMTPAGTIPPARVLVLGAGVAGLQAIAVARRLGAVVEAFDVRRAAREEVESLGATFVEADLGEAAEPAGGYARELSEESRRRAAEVIRQRLARADACITTALTAPEHGRRAPVLITEEMVRGMRPGSVIVDAAADQGGNCALTEPGRDVVRHGVTIIGRLNLAGDVAVHASQMYSRNVETLLGRLVRDGALALDDPVLRPALLTHGGRVSDPPAGGQPAPAGAPPPPGGGA